MPDLCHPGLLLRALLAVHLALALGCAFAAEGPTAWWWLFAQAAAQAVPAVLAWVAGVCMAQRWQRRTDEAGLQSRRASPAGSAPPLPAAMGTGSTTMTPLFGVAAALWGGCCALGVWWAWGAVQVGPWAAPAVPLQRPLAQAAAGVVTAAALLAWARARAQRHAPQAHTARLIELQSRIRPHFLFNSLNTAMALIRVDPARAESVLEDLSELFRAALGRGEAAPVATLGEEIELARRYLAIEQLRFGHRLQLSWELDPEAARARLPSLVLQPLLENAVRHGVEPSAAGGRIVVRTGVRLGQAWVLVVNSVPESTAELFAESPAAAATAAGAEGGGHAEHRPTLPSGHGLALRNVRERLMLLHDLGAHFEAGRRGAEYRVELAVPLQAAPTVLDT